MTKKTKTIEKTLHFNCSTCQKIYQLIETHYVKVNPYLRVGECSDNCQTKWQDLLHEHYQEKVLGYIRKQEESKETEEED